MTTDELLREAARLLETFGGTAPQYNGRALAWLAAYEARRAGTTTEEISALAEAVVSAIYAVDDSGCGTPAEFRKTYVAETEKVLGKAVAEAEERGATKMREAVAQFVSDFDFGLDSQSGLVRDIRALPVTPAAIAARGKDGR